MCEFTIIIPVFNEEENLYQVEKSLLRYIPIASKKPLFLFVNDGSTDGSERIIKEICSRNPDFHYISLTTNHGLSTALKAGFAWVRTPILGYIDSDLQTTPEDFNLLLPYLDKYDLVTGIRKGRKDGIIKNTSSLIANGIRRIFTNDGMLDTGCPLKVIKTEFAQRIPMFEGLHRFLPAMILLQKGTIHQVPVRHFPRKGGKTKFGITNRFFGPLTACFVYVWMKRNYIHFEVKKD